MQGEKLSMWEVRVYACAHLPSWLEWELTGDICCLRAGWLGQWEALGAWAVKGPACAHYMALANAWRGNLRHMYWADQAGFLKDLST